MTLLVVLGAWFLAGVLTTLVLGPRLRRAADLAGATLEAEPVFAAHRSPLRWRVGTLGVVGLLAGSTGMAAAGALPGSAQTIAHHVLGTVGVDVPEEQPAAEVASGPSGTSRDDLPAGAPTPSTSAAQGAPPDTAPAPPAPEAGTGSPGTVASVGGDDDVVAAPSTRSSAAPSTTEPPAEGAAVAPSEPSDAGSDPVVPREEPSDVPPDPVVEDPPPTTTTTTTPPGETPTTTAPPPEDPPVSAGGTTTTTTPEDPGPPPAG